MTKIIIKNADLICCMDEKNKKISGDIYIEHGKIVDVGKRLDEKYGINGIEIIDADGCVVFPGFVNTHHHLYQTLCRGIHEIQEFELFDWLKYLYELWKKITPEFVYISTLVGCAELILSGCTTTSDMFYIFPKDQPKDLIDFEIQAAREIGMRFHPARGAMSMGKSKGGLPPDEIVQDEDEILEDYERLVSMYHDEKEFSMCRISLAPCSPFSVTTDLLKQTIEFARKNKLLCHTHISETDDEVRFCIEKFNKRPVEYLMDLNWLGEDIWLAHCIHLSQNELDLICKTRTGVSHCPTSNMKLSSGIAPVKKLKNGGARVSLAVDGSASNDSSNMLLELRQAFLLNRLNPKDERLTIDEIFYMATRGGADVLGRDDIGSIEVGKAADIVGFDLNEIYYAGCKDLDAGVILCGGDFRAKFVVINGEIVVDNFELKKIDLNKIIHQANEITKKCFSS